MREDTVAEHFRLSDKLEINQKIEFRIYSGNYEGKYPTQIVDVREDEESFVINAPFSRGQPLTVPINTRAEVKLRKDEGIYLLPVKVIAREVDVTPLLVLSLREKVKKIQERQFFRLDFHERTKYRIIANNNKEFEEMVGVSDEPKEGVSIETNKKLPDLDTPGIVKDVSAGGIKLATDNKLEAGQILEVDFEFMEASFSTLFGEIIRVEEKERDGVKRYEAGLEFIYCNQKHRDEITSWLFAKQRELRRKGLI